MFLDFGKGAGGDVKFKTPQNEIFYFSRNDLTCPVTF